MDGKVNQDKLKEAQKTTELKKVTEAQILQEALKEGNRISLLAGKALQSQLQYAIKNKGLTEAIGYCNTRANQVIDSVAKASNASIRRTSLKVRSERDHPDSVEFKILEAYQYNADNGLAMSNNIQKLSDQELLFTKPIHINDPICLSCHGEPGKELNNFTHKAILDLYPEDQATGYKFGEFRGMWSIRLTKKELIKNL